MESNFNPKAKSHKGAMGLMQLMPFTADDVAARFLISGGVPLDNLFYPDINIDLATYYFYNLLKRLDGNAIYALASYNAGPSRFREWQNQNANLSDMEFIEQIPLEETNGYVKNILRNYIIYSYIIDKRLVTFKDFKNSRYYESVRIIP